MKDEEEWTPWIEHDGAAPFVPPGFNIGERVVFDIVFDGPGIVPALDDVIDADYPGFYWRWRKTGFICKVGMRVCDNPAYAPIKKYRLSKGRRLSEYDRLEELVRDPDSEITGPEVPPVTMPEPEPESIYQRQRTTHD